MLTNVSLLTSLLAVEAAMAEAWAAESVALAKIAASEAMKFIQQAAAVKGVLLKAQKKEADAAAALLIAVETLHKASHKVNVAKLFLAHSTTNAIVATDVLEKATTIAMKAQADVRASSVLRN